jgi:23S rRNA (uracil1939-C5)-methyltransferase
MKKTQPIQTNIQSLSHDGRGIASINGKTSFINGALAQEEVICQLTKKHSRYNEGEIIEVLTPSPLRIKPHCAHFNVCGGCSLQHLNLDAQIQLKQKALLEQLLHFGKVTPENILPPISGNPWHYRRKARLGVRYVRKKEQVFVGFREKSSNFLTDVQACSVLHASIGLKIKELGELIQSLSLFDQIPQVEVAVSDHETALIFRHMAAVTEEDLKKLCLFAEEHHFHIYLQPNSPAKIHKIWPVNSPEKLSYQINLPEKTLTMEFHPLDFVQVNGEINQLMLQQALHLLQPKSDENILDLFCGLGNFTLPLALKANHVTGVEGSQEMVKRAEENAALNQILNTSFYAANLMEPNTSADWINKRYDKVLLDPPRTGAKEILPHFSRFKAKTICYVSCNPATLARDAGELVYTHKYRLKHVGVVNMFPHTAHIEAIALFEK